MKKIAFIGLGVMGFHMASHLSKSGIEVLIYNRTRSKAEKWNNDFRGEIAKSINQIGEESDMVFMCLGNDKDVQEVITSENGLLSSLKSGSIIIDHTTTSAAIAQEMFKLTLEKGIDFIDAPVSGGQIGAQKGILTVMAGGKIEPFNKVTPLIMSYAKHCQLMGQSGSGQLTKMVNQICLAGLIQGLAEGLHFSEMVGLDSKKVVEVISKGAAQSWQMDNRANLMIDDFYDHGFSVDLMKKDLGIVLKEAKEKKASLEVTTLVSKFYEEIQVMHGGRWDTSSLLKRLTKKT